MLEDEFELAFGEEPARTLKGRGRRLRAWRDRELGGPNRSTKTKTRVLPVNLHPRDVKQIMTLFGKG